MTPHLPTAPTEVTRYVDVSMANVRSGPSTDYRVVRQLRRNTRVTGTKTSNGWIKIKSGQYISESILSTRSSSTSSSSRSNTVTRYVNVSSGNVRSGSSTSYRVVKSLPRNTKLTGTKTSNGWIKIKSGQYISGSILSTRSSSGSSSSSSARTTTRYITASMGNVRSGSSTSHRIVTSLSRGTRVEGTLQRNGWLRIGSGRYVSPVILSSRGPSSASRSRSTVTRYVTSSSGNVRSGAGTNYQVVDSLRRNSKVTGTLTSNGWLRISSDRYISGNILRGASAGGSSSPSSNAVINEASRHLGIMYVYGGDDPSGFDCSGYVQYVYGKLGVVLPRVVSQQRVATTRVSSPKVGDLVFWGTRHVAIYAGDGYIYDSGRSGLPVQKRRMFSGVTGYGRVG
ncbi:MAG: SH3 domain-containing protein [Ornithinimicrobium sp.]